ncbi:MAG: response regulator transcription factor [Deltaproteobacteria bacterium]|nr:response regulator transcription factor [Deltaproteobacteria bacterium]MBW2019879.1 response regulator transcription factor [Deltaproteobacteria bacterium]MBW2074988.1 response regulator transcription factor [Deltaproteobacteria bacterium]RLB82440.1 MAG: DNA-binding response regulator [Deltaproteobacteria bacterium]
MVQKKSILIIDDHPLFREGLKSLIARNPSFEVVGEAGNGREGLKLAKDLKPDLVVMDISLPDKSGIKVTHNIRSLLAETRVMVVSVHSKIDYITEAFRAGATGYVAKESATDRLLQGLETVSRGEYFLDSSLSHKVVKKLMESPEKETKITDARYERLTSREQQVMRLLAEGLSTKEIAKKLFISPKTVENHRANIMNKLDLHSTIELVRYAVRLGLIDVDLWKD